MKVDKSRQTFADLKASEKVNVTDSPLKVKNKSSRTKSKDKEKRADVVQRIGIKPE